MSEQNKLLEFVERDVYISEFGTGHITTVTKEWLEFDGNEYWGFEEGEVIYSDTVLNKRLSEIHPSEIGIFREIQWNGSE